MRTPAEFVNHPLPFIGGKYRGVVTYVVDGDTVDLMLDVGLNEYRYLNCRIFGINAPELNTEAGKLAAEYLKTHALRQPCRVTTVRDKDKYGRYLATIELVEFDQNFIDVAAMMIQAGHAVEYIP